jgi:hypothetical protein
MSNPAQKVSTRCAHWGFVDHRYFGHAVFGELAGHQSITGLLAISVLGRCLEKDECAVIDDVAACATLADPRIWPLKLTRIVASYGSVGSAIAAGILSLEEACIGPDITTDAAKLLVDMHSKTKGATGSCVTPESFVSGYLESHRIVPGFGTPFRAFDERLVALRRCIQERHRDRLPYFQTMNDLIENVQRRRAVEPNIGLAIAACFLDLGLRVEHIGAMTLATMFHMFLANGLEGADQRLSVLQELPEQRIEYVGVAARRSSRFLAANRHG